MNKKAELATIFAVASFVFGAFGIIVYSIGFQNGVDKTNDAWNNNKYNVTIDKRYFKCVEERVFSTYSGRSWRRKHKFVKDCSNWVYKGYSND